MRRSDRRGDGTDAKLKIGTTDGGCGAEIGGHARHLDALSSPPPSTVQSCCTSAILAVPPNPRTRLRTKVAALVRFRRPARVPSSPSLPDTVPHPEHASIVPPATALSAASLPDTHTPAPMTQYSSPSPPPTKPNLKAWWRGFTFVQGAKRPPPDTTTPYRPHDTADHPVFGKSLNDSLTYASVQISTANANGDLYVWGYIPVVVAKWFVHSSPAHTVQVNVPNSGLYLKENGWSSPPHSPVSSLTQPAAATEVPGTFRVNGSNKRMRDLQAAFETPPRYGKSLDWRQETYTTHDVASVFRRYLTQMPEPVIPYDMYHLFRDALSKTPFNHEETVSTFKSLIRRMPRPNQYLLLYVLDLLSVFARKSDKNLMTATNLAVIFRPGILSHPEHEMSPAEHALSQRVLEFLIAQQDWFMLDISPPPETGPDSTSGGGGGGGGSRHGHGGGGGGGQGGGKRREGGPSRRGTGDSAGPGTSGGAGGASGSAGGTSAGAGGNVAALALGTQRNAEAGPSRKRVGSLPAPIAPMSTPVGIWGQPQTPAQQVIAQAQAASSNPNRHGGQLTENISPPSSAPPSPTVPGFPGGRAQSHAQRQSGLSSGRRSSPLGTSRNPQHHQHQHGHGQPHRPGHQRTTSSQTHPQTNAGTSTQYYPPIYAALHTTSPEPQAESQFHSQRPSLPPPPQAHIQPPQPFSSLNSRPLPSGASDFSSIMYVPAAIPSRPSHPSHPSNAHSSSLPLPLPQPPTLTSPSSIDVEMEDDALSIGSGWRLIGYAPTPAADGVKPKHPLGGLGVGYGGGYGTAVGGGGFLKMGKEKPVLRGMDKEKDDKENKEGKEREAREKEKEKKELRMVRRRTTAAHPGSELALVAPILEDAPSSSTATGASATGASGSGVSVQRSRTLPSRRKGGLDEGGGVEGGGSPNLQGQGVQGQGQGRGQGQREKRVLKKQRRASTQTGSEREKSPTTTPIPAPRTLGWTAGMGGGAGAGS
ncbi:unnamed protein product [Cyclocybe aegerita]|uniref:Rho-GAP domain-containing protein n=1 Tax=Cyclocybe aegerita TaxID=1973307 RepID=A0A8S0XNI1_CYCAE|nr:unnamed protein product [Cyclocybe aegerita]